MGENRLTPGRDHDVVDYSAFFEMPLDHTAAFSARQIVRQLLPAWGLQDDNVVFDASIIVSELVTNAVTHSGVQVTLRLSVLNSNVTVSVEDGHPTGPQRPLHEADSLDHENGRGIALVAALSSAWGVDQTPGGGKAVWARFDSPV